MEKINYDIGELIGDLLSKDGFYIELLNCHEATIWYLIRQFGIRSYLPVIGTNSFINAHSFKETDKIEKGKRENLYILFNNLNKYFGVKIKYYTSKDKSYKNFIKEAIHKNKFVYALYDNYFDTLDENRVDENSKHGHPIVGYDDDKKVYLGITKTQREIKYDDLNAMIKDGYKKNRTYKITLFYFDEAYKQPGKETIETVEKSLIKDIKNCIAQWNNEMLFFANEIEDINKSVEYSLNEKIYFAFIKNNFYNLLMSGTHGNFIFKLRVISDLFKIDTSELEKNFFINRKNAMTISNMFRKSEILLDKNEEYYNVTIPKICAKIHQTYIQQGEELLNAFYKTIKFIGIA
jgi:hypothetical protein